MFLGQFSIASAECQCPVTRAFLASGNLVVRTPIKPHFLFNREGPRRRKLALSRSWRGAGFEETDIAVFRFTLGIPGFDDALIPRVVGLIGAALLVTNHLLDQSDATSAQIRTELLGSLLSATCILTPSIGKRLKEAQRGRGRPAKDMQAPANTTEIFQIADDASERCRTELAWSSYALLRNTNSRGMIVVAGKKLWLARGAVDSGALQGNGSKSLVGSSKAVSDMSSSVEEFIEGRESVYLANQSSIENAGAYSWSLLPQSSASLLIQALHPLATAEQQVAESSSMTERNRMAEMRLPGGDRQGFVLLWSDRPRSLSQRERLWAAAVAAKLQSVLV